jgi:hypothetical protein
MGIPKFYRWLSGKTEEEEEEAFLRCFSLLPFSIN